VSRRISSGRRPRLRIRLRLPLIVVAALLLAIGIHDGLSNAGKRHEQPESQSTTDTQTGSSRSKIGSAQPAKPSADSQPRAYPQADPSNDAAGDPPTPLFGRVVAIADGDTLKVLDASLREHRIRLLGIDAPERNQPWGQRSRQAISRLAFQQPVRVEWAKRDRFGRVLGNVWVAPPDSDCRGQLQCPTSLDVSLEQLRTGHAWWYRQFAKDQPPAQRKLYEQAQSQARERRVGLWQQTDPQPPWEYRRHSKSKPGGL
jgi:endonuclease YncB( thermonuclease family)